MVSVAVTYQSDASATGTRVGPRPVLVKLDDLLFSREFLLETQAGRLPVYDEGGMVAYLSDADVDRFYAAVGSRVRSTRAGRGMSQAGLAQQIGFTRSSVSNLEAGRQRIALHLLVQIARALDCEPAALIPEVAPTSSVDGAVLDELTEHLDAPAREFVRRAVGQLVPDAER